MKVAARKLRTPARTDSSRVRALRVAGHGLKLFTETRPLIASMAADIRSAQQRVWLETYIYHLDRAGREVAEALKDRARAGLDVRLICDALGSKGTPPAFFNDLQEAGVKVHVFHSFWEALSRLAFLHVLNRRDHRKLLVVDDRVAYFGGMNVVDQTDVDTPRDLKAKHLPASAGWRDVHVRMEGRRAVEVAEHFDQLWRRIHRLPRPRRPRVKRRRDARHNGDSFHFYSSQPGFKHSRAARVFTELFRRARRRIVLSMAYFIPVGRVLRALLAARKRGVEVTVIVPGESDVKLVQAACRHFYTRLLKSGVRIFERQHKMLHSKVMVVDDRWTLVGSSNLDPRSLWFNLEFLAVIRSSGVAAMIGEICEFEVRQSRPISLADCGNRPWWRRGLDRLAWTVRHWL